MFQLKTSLLNEFYDIYLHRNSGKKVIIRNPLNFHVHNCDYQLIATIICEISIRFHEIHFSKGDDQLFSNASIQIPILTHRVWVRVSVVAPYIFG